MRLDIAKDFKFVPDAKSAHGIFADSEGTTVKSVRAIGELGRNQMLDPYFSLTGTAKNAVRVSVYNVFRNDRESYTPQQSIAPQRITTQKTKLYVLVPGSLNLSEECNDLICNQFRVAHEVEALHESTLEQPNDGTYLHAFFFYHSNNLSYREWHSRARSGSTR